MMVALFAYRVAGHAVRDFMQQNCGFDAGFGNANPQPRCSGLEGSRGVSQRPNFRRIRKTGGPPHIVDYGLRLLERHGPRIIGMDVAVFPSVAGGPLVITDHDSMPAERRAPTPWESGSLSPAT